jgi:hypothetical protein
MKLSPLFEDVREERRLEHLCRKILAEVYEYCVYFFKNAKYWDCSWDKSHPELVRLMRIHPNGNTYAYEVSVFFPLLNTYKAKDFDFYRLDSSDDDNLETKEAISDIVEMMGIDEYAVVLHLVKEEPIYKDNSFIMYQDGTIENNFIV